MRGCRFLAWLTAPAHPRWNGQPRGRTGESRKKAVIKKLLLACLLPLGLCGCLSFSSQTPPKNTTIIVPPGSAVTCAPGQTTPC